MSTKKEEERNEKMIRGLMKLPPNRRCINCNSLGPQYVCTNFWTFVCIACSGIHREFTHRVKSVSMAKFTTQEVEALQRGGNQRARELFLKDWDTQRMRLPDNSNPVRIREFIKNVYVDKKYAGSRSSDKPPRDTQSLKGEEDHRRASSYHSFSQSPPYDHQYEERRYGRQAGMLTRKPGSDRGHYEGKLSSFLYSPGRQAEQMYEDRFANESSSRMSDYSVSSDPFRFDGQSPNSHDSGYNSPPAQVRDIIVEGTRPQKLGSFSESNLKEDVNRIPRAHRSASSGSFGSFDSNSISLKSANSGSLIDSVLDAEHAFAIQPADSSTWPPLPQIASAANAAKINLFSLEFVQSQNTFSAPSIDLFADVNHKPSSIPPTNERKPPVVPLSENEGWANFDLPHHTESPFKASQGLPPVVPPSEKAPSMESIDLFSSTSDWFSVQNPASHGHSLLVADQWSMGSNEVKESAESRNSQVACSDGFLSSAIDDKAPTVATLTGMASSSFHPPAIPQMVGTTQERKAPNPFDLPFDSESEANNTFLDMSSLQAALPDPQLPAAFLGGLPDPWFQQNSLTTSVPPVSQGGLSYIGGQVPSAQLQNIPSQGPVAPLGGNPFA